MRKSDLMFIIDICVMTAIVLFAMSVWYGMTSAIN
jgi:hypothetical protein